MLHAITWWGSARNKDECPQRKKKKKKKKAHHRDEHQSYSTLLYCQFPLPAYSTWLLGHLRRQQKRYKYIKKNGKQEEEEEEERTFLLFIMNLIYKPIAILAQSLFHSRLVYFRFSYKIKKKYKRSSRTVRRRRRSCLLSCRLAFCIFLPPAFIFAIFPWFDNHLCCALERARRAGREYNLRTEELKRAHQQTSSSDSFSLLATTMATTTSMHK